MVKRAAQVTDDNSSDSRLAYNESLEPPAIRETRHAEILQEIELHKLAQIVVDEAVDAYRENLYVLARQLANEQLDPGVVTRAHVRQAQALMARPRRRYNWDDGLLAVGGLMLGGALPHVLDLSQNGGAGNPILISLGLIGAVIFGMGLLAKAKF